MPAARMAARAAAARRGEAGACQHEARKAAGKAQEGTWHEERRRVHGTGPVKRRRCVG
jgi:hypothetical protein